MRRTSAFCQKVLAVFPDLEVSFRSGPGYTKIRARKCRARAMPAQMPWPPAPFSVQPLSQACRESKSGAPVPQVARHSGPSPAPHGWIPAQLFPAVLTAVASVATPFPHPRLLLPLMRSFFLPLFSFFSASQAAILSALAWSLSPSFFLGFHSIEQ